MLIIDNIPLSVRVSKNKQIALNLNVYRNLHYQVNNKAKHALTDIMRNELVGCGLIQDFPLKFVYTIYRKTHRAVDLMNIGSVLDKFVCDALVQMRLLPDDNTKYIAGVEFIDGGVDKQNPHAKLEIRKYERM
ncbi:MAG: hypothetical protein HQK63_06195 [Desulfamplus sp.]|nr:hypothetical protein [Desulfamplus sp.]